MSSQFETTCLLKASPFKRGAPKELVAHISSRRLSHIVSAARTARVWAARPVLRGAGPTAPRAERREAAARLRPVSRAAGLVARRDSHERRFGEGRRPCRPPSAHPSSGQRRHRGPRPEVRRRRRHTPLRRCLRYRRPPGRHQVDQLRPLLTRVVPAHTAMVPASPASRLVCFAQALTSSTNCLTHVARGCLMARAQRNFLAHDMRCPAEQSDFSVPR